jgi:hypothetical protein
MQYRKPGARSYITITALLIGSIVLMLRLVGFLWRTPPSSECSSGGLGGLAVRDATTIASLRTESALIALGMLNTEAIHRGNGVIPPKTVAFTVDKVLKGRSWARPGSTIAVCNSSDFDGVASTATVRTLVLLVGYDQQQSVWVAWGSGRGIVATGPDGTYNLSKRLLLDQGSSYLALHEASVETLFR